MRAAPHPKAVDGVDLCIGAKNLSLKSFEALVAPKPASGEVPLIVQRLDQGSLQGLINCSEGLHRETIVAKANKAIQQIEECQLCGNKGHLAKQCKVLNKELCDCVQDAL